MVKFVITLAPLDFPFPLDAIAILILKQRLLIFVPCSGFCSKASISAANSSLTKDIFSPVALVVYQKGEWLIHYNSSNNSLAGRAFNFPFLTSFKLSTASLISLINCIFSSLKG